MESTIFFSLLKVSLIIFICTLEYLTHQLNELQILKKITENELQKICSQRLVLSWKIDVNVRDSCPLFPSQLWPQNCVLGRRTELEDIQENLEDVTAMPGAKAPAKAGTLIRH